MSNVNNSFVQMTKLGNVRGRVRYITDPKRQENLYATYSNVPDKFWYHLHKQNRKDFAASGTEGKCIEARELILMLPPSLIEYDHDALLAAIVGTFTMRYDVGCAAALHHNKKKTNLHVHLIFSERESLEVPEEKIATRNRFYNETGKHARTKKEILDEEGNIRKGCKVIKKGEVYERNLFKPKDPVFKSKDFLNQMKEVYTAQFNHLIKNENERLQVFSAGGPYLATKKIGKNNPLEKEIKTDNYLRKQWNHMVDRSLLVGVPEDSIMGIKKRSITNKVVESIKNYGKQPGRFTTILQEAIGILRGFMERFKNFGDFKIDRDGNVIASKKLKLDITPEALPPREKGPYPSDEKEKSEFMRLENINKRLKNKEREIGNLEKDIQSLEQELSAIKPHIWNKKEREEIKETITSKKCLIEQKLSNLELIPKEYGYTNVASFKRYYVSAFNKLDKIKELQRAWKAPDPEPETKKVYVVPNVLEKEQRRVDRLEEKQLDKTMDKSTKPRSIKDKLENNKRIVEEQKASTKRRNVDRDSR